MLELIIDALSERLEVEVSTQRPIEANGEYVTVVQTGGGGDRFTEDIQLTVHCWSTSDISAYRLAKTVEKAMFALYEDLDNVADVEQNSLYANVFTDGTPRWTGLYFLTTNRM